MMHRVVLSAAVVALVAAAGCGGTADEQAAGGQLADSTASTALTAPNIQFVVYDGTTLPTVIAGCSEPTCLGGADGSNPTPGTGVVTHAKNNVGWMVAGGFKGAVYLYVDGQRAASARSGKLLVWSAAPGTHSLQTVAYAADGTAGWSPTLTITAQ